MKDGHNPYFNRWFSAMCKNHRKPQNRRIVTILILIDGFLQYRKISWKNSWSRVTILILIDGFLQYDIGDWFEFIVNRHNPYFNRWFSAIQRWFNEYENQTWVTILILIDGFLQFKKHLCFFRKQSKSQSLF